MLLRHPDTHLRAAAKAAQAIAQENKVEVQHADEAPYAEKGEEGDFVCQEFRCYVVYRVPFLERSQTPIQRLTFKRILCC